MLNYMFQINLIQLHDNLFGIESKFIAWMLMSQEKLVLDYNGGIKDMMKKLLWYG